MLRTALLAIALLLGLSACYGGGWTNGPGIDLSGPHARSLNSGGGGPSGATFRGGPGADSLP